MSEQVTTEREQAVVQFLHANRERSKFYADLLDKFGRFGYLTVRQVEAVERSMNATPAPAPENPITEEGMYRMGDAVYRVKRSRESHNLYAMRFVPEAAAKSERFVYERGAIFRLSAENRMTIEEAEALGASVGICCVCGATLSDPNSVRRGIGPVCAKRV